MERLEQFIVRELPLVAYYVPDFIAENEGKYLMEKVYAAPKPKWTQLAHRRLQNWGGLPHPKGMFQEALPTWLETYAQKLSGLGIFDNKIPNHVLVNEYEPGQGIMPHEDGPLFYPTIATINLGCHTLLDFYYRMDDNRDLSNQYGTVQTNIESRYFASLLLEPQSLLVLKEDMYQKYLHGIRERTTDLIDEKVVNIKFCKANYGDCLTRTTRISLTIRHVPKTARVRLLKQK